MAKNRTEAKAVVTSWAPVLDLELTHKPDLRDEILDNCLFRKDVTDTTTASGAKALSFTDLDYITVTQTSNTLYTLSGILQGEIKFLKITKSATDEVSFNIATDISQRKAFINSSVTDIIYKITNKDGSLYVESVNIDNNIPNRTKEINIGDWDMNATAFVNIPHGLSFAAIRSVRVIIYSDDDAVIYPTSFDIQITDTPAAPGTNITLAGSYFYDGTNIVLSRLTGGTFDSTIFDKTSYNRGIITIEYAE